MISVTMRYPGDPPDQVILMYGAEFHTFIRGGKPASIQLNGAVVATFDEIICDRCNAEILMTDACAMTGAYVYCAKCMKTLAQYFDPRSVKIAGW